MSEDGYNEVIIDSLSYFPETAKVDVYAFVKMPNSIHLIWKNLASNGKETAQGSFLKFTAQKFRKLQQAAGNLQKCFVGK